jgi:hypothetical protein
VDPSPESLDQLLSALESNVTMTNLSWQFGRAAMEDAKNKYLSRNMDRLRQKRLAAQRESGAAAKQVWSHPSIHICACTQTTNDRLQMDFMHAWLGGCVNRLRYKVEFNRLLRTRMTKKYSK